MYLVYELVRKNLKIICPLLMILLKRGLWLLVRFEVFIKASLFQLKKNVSMERATLCSNFEAGFQFLEGTEKGSD